MKDVIHTIRFTCGMKSLCANLFIHNNKCMTIWNCISSGLHSVNSRLAVIITCVMHKKKLMSSTLKVLTVSLLYSIVYSMYA